MKEKAIKEYVKLIWGFTIGVLFQGVLTFHVKTRAGRSIDTRRLGAEFEFTIIITIFIIYTLTIRVRGARRLGKQDT